jgi:hypothetical protein
MSASSSEIASPEEMMELKGGCLCGAVRYTARAEPVILGICHCRDCQKFTGSAFGFLVGVPRIAFEIDGVVKRFAKPADSGKPIVRLFCPECGSSVAEELASQPGLVLINGGTLDDPTAVIPATEIYCDRMLPWVQLGDMQRFAKMPA